MVILGGFGISFFLFLIVKNWNIFFEYIGWVILVFFIFIIIGILIFGILVDCYGRK